MQGDKVDVDNNIAEGLEYFRAPLDGIMIFNDDINADAVIAGEVVIVAERGDNQTLIVHDFWRIAIWSEVLEQANGRVSFASWTVETGLEPALEGEAEIEARLYYPLLGSELEPACSNFDATYPRMEILRGQLRWEPIEEPIDRNRFGLRLHFELTELVEEHLGEIQTAVFDGPIELLFESMTPLSSPENKQPEEDGLPLVADVFMLPFSDCETDDFDPSSHPHGNLYIRFINISSEPTPLLEDLAERLVRGACRVWWQKAGIKATPETTATGAIVHDPTSSVSSTVNTTAQAETINNTLTPGDGFIDVYLADSVNSNWGGGISRHCGSSDAFIVLGINIAPNNHYLLAHELGHALGLRHPDEGEGEGCGPFAPGSYCSIMVPGKPNSRRNTQHNISTVVAQLLPMMPLADLFDSTVTGGWRADNDTNTVFQYVRDFPYDDGIEDSVPEDPFQYSWTDSDVWNAHLEPHSSAPDEEYSDGTLMFNADHSPNHTEPSHSVTNYMYVRVHTCHQQTSAASVAIHLYLGSAGAFSGKDLIKIPDPSLPTPGPNDPTLTLNPLWDNPAIGHVAWSVPAGCPPHFCVFAVASSTQDPWTGGDILSLSLGDMFALRNADNDVAQRNLNIQGCSSGGASLRTALPRLYMANPFEEAKTAAIRIDTRKAPTLESLSLEINGESRGGLPIGSVKQIEIEDGLQSDEDFIMRFAARLPPNQKEGVIFPIDVEFLLNDRVITGYRHLIRITPLTEVAVQVLDHVVGMSRDVGIAFNVNDAHILSKKVREIVRRERGFPPGCLAVLLESVRGKPGDWRTEFTKLSPYFIRLSENPEVKNKASQGAIVAKYFQEMGKLIDSQDKLGSSNFLELVRDLTERIQEQTWRIIRHT